MSDAAEPIGTDLAVIDAEIIEIEGLMADQRSAYWRGPEAEQNQARFRDLTDARDAQAQTPAPSPKAARMAEIEAIMADTMGPYWRGTQAKALQAEYIALQEGDSVAEPSPPRAVSEPSDPFPDIGREPLGADQMLSDWGASDAGGALVEKWGEDFEQSARDAQFAAGDMLAQMPEGARNHVITMFDKLPDRIRYQVIESLAAVGARLR